MTFNKLQSFVFKKNQSTVFLIIFVAESQLLQTFYIMYFDVYLFITRDMCLETIVLIVIKYPTWKSIRAR